MGGAFRSFEMMCLWEELDLEDVVGLELGLGVDLEKEESSSSAKLRRAGFLGRALRSLDLGLAGVGVGLATVGAGEGVGSSSSSSPARRRKFLLLLLITGGVEREQGFGFEDFFVCLKMR